MKTIEINEIDAEAIEGPSAVIWPPRRQANNPVYRIKQVRPVLYDKSKPARTIGATGVRVPDAVFKAILDETPPRKMIAFIVDNADTKAKPRPLVVTVDEVERRTGFDLFSKLPKEEQSRLEVRSDFGAW